jgi:hypothetical protein
MESVMVTISLNKIAMVVSSIKYKFLLPSAETFMSQSMCDVLNRGFKSRLKGSRLCNTLILRIVLLGAETWVLKANTYSESQLLR